MFGLLFLIAGLWMMEKQWDDQASQAYQRAKENGAGGGAGSGSGDFQAPNDDKITDVESNDYQPAPDGTTTTTTTQQAEPAVTVSPEELKAALPLPSVIVAGFGLWALSFIFSANGGFSFDISFWSILSMVLVGFIGYIVALPMRKATWTRNRVLKKQAVSIVLLLTTALAITGRVESSLSIWFFNIFGGKNTFIPFRL